MWRKMDEAAIDGLMVNGTAAVAAGAGNILRRIQSGNLRSYAAWVLLGTVVWLAYILLRPLEEATHRDSSRPIPSVADSKARGAEGKSPMLSWLQNHQLTALTFLPLLGAAVLGFVRRDAAGRIRGVALVTSLLAFALDLRIFFSFSATDLGPQFVEHYPWISSPPINYHLGVDGL